METKPEKRSSRAGTYFQPTAKSLKRDKKLYNTPNHWRYTCLMIKEENKGKGVSDG